MTTAEAAQKAVVSRKFLNVKKNARKIRSGKSSVAHKRSQSKLDKKQIKKIKDRCALRKVVKPKDPRFPRAYATQEAKGKLCLRKTSCFKNHKRRIRSSITPGTILIILAGRHKGKRVVFLKSLQSGLLLVTGPCKYNGVPLRRVNQRYVIATKTKIRLSGVNVPTELNDEFFRRVCLKSKSKPEDKIFAEETKNYNISEERKKIQKKVDRSVLSALKSQKSPSMLAAYLKSMFSLSKKDYPHKMVF